MKQSFKSYVEDVKDLPKDKQRALQKAASSAKKTVTLPGPGGSRYTMKKKGDAWKKQEEGTGLSRDTLSSYSAKASDARLHKKLPIKKVDNRYSGVSKASKHLDDYNSGKIKAKEGKAYGPTGIAYSTDGVERMKKKSGHDPKHVKQAIGIASDPRYKQGNMTGAVKAMNKLSPGIHTHKQVAAVLKRQNESMDDEHLKNAQAAYDKHKDVLGNIFKKHGFNRPTKASQNRQKELSKKDHNKLKNLKVKMGEEWRHNELKLLEDLKALTKKHNIRNTTEDEEEYIKHEGPDHHKEMMKHHQNASNTHQENGQDKAANAHASAADAHHKAMKAYGKVNHSSTEFTKHDEHAMDAGEAAHDHTSRAIRSSKVASKVSEDLSESTEFGQTRWVAVNRFAGNKQMGSGVQMTGLNGQGRSTMDLLKQKGAYCQFPVKDIPKVIKMLQKVYSDKAKPEDE